MIRYDQLSGRVVLQVELPEMRFPDSLLDEIRERLPVSEVVRRRVQLKKQGREWRGLSPFNKEKTPSFYVNDQKGFYHDFSSGKHGDIFGFVMETEGLTFPEAVERLAGIAGVPLPVSSAEAEEKEVYRRTLHEIMELAAKFFEGNLGTQRGSKARGYLADRGVLPATQLEFRIGYALPERFALKEYLGSQGVTVEKMIEAGLLISGDDIPVPYDRFRDRVIIPIQDQRGQVIAFGGRTLNNDIQPKYLNSPETPLFHKGSAVFNFHRARQSARQDGSVVVVEGYLDAITIYQAGLKSVVASMGTAFTDDQIALLWRLSTEPIVCFDADNAGINAAYRSLDRILPQLKIGQTFRFAFIYGEKDPDDLVREKGVDAFKGILQGALPMWDMLWQRETDNVSVETPDAQAKLEHKLKNIVSSIKDETVRVAYGRTCRIQLANHFWQATRSKFFGASEKKTKLNLRIEKEGRRHGIQKVILGTLVHYPELLDEKSDSISKINFSPELEGFRQALYELLILGAELSVQMIYSRLKPDFYPILEDIHGERVGERPWGHRLFQRFPILRLDPPHEYVSSCINSFVDVLIVEQMNDNIKELEVLAASSDEASERLLELVRDFHLQLEVARNRENELADEAKEISRLWAPSESKAQIGAI
jgi:DNA primase